MVEEIEPLKNELLNLGQPDIVVDFVRHGKAEYSEEPWESTTFEGALTSEGRDQAENAAQTLVSRMNKDKELLVLWTSPKKRALETVAIMLPVFYQNGILPHELSVRTLLQDVQLDISQLREYLESDFGKTAIEQWLVSKNLPKGNETPEQLTHRTNSVLFYLDKAARVVQPSGGKRLRFVLIGHEETAINILQFAFREEPTSKLSPKNGEILELGIYQSVPKELNTRVVVNYRDYLDGVIYFDPVSRELSNSKEYEKTS